MEYGRVILNTYCIGIIFTLVVLEFLAWVLPDKERQELEDELPPDFSLQRFIGYASLMWPVIVIGLMGDMRKK